MNFLRSFAWVSLVISSTMTVVSVINLLVMHFLFGSIPTSKSPMITGLPALVLSNVELFGTVVLAYAVGGIVGSVGTLRGKKWGVGLLTALLVLGILWGVVVIGFEIAATGSPADNGPSLGLLKFRSVITSVVAFCWMIACFWLIHKIRIADRSTRSH